jgi:sugar lactone lactonase YvrE
VGWDLARGTAYATHKFGRKVVALNLESGESTTVYETGYRPESIAVTPDGRWLYVALLTREHDPGWWDEDGH